MREIKFRALRDGEWFYSDSQESATALGARLGQSVSGVFWNHFAGFQTLSEYTGLEDKNGKDIYEGDVVGGDDRTYEVRFGRHCVASGDYYGDQFGAYGWYLAQDGSDELTESLTWNDGLSVVGNIYENPELNK